MKIKNVSKYLHGCDMRCDIKLKTSWNSILYLED